MRYKKFLTLLLRRGMVFLLTASLLSGFGFISASWAQQTPTSQKEQQAPPQPLTYELEVDLVQIAVRVADKDGNWVSGIKPSDLELLEDGVAQEIRYVDEIQAEGPVPEIKSQPIPIAERKEFLIESTIPNSIIVLFDTANTGQLGIEKHRKYVKDFLRNFDAANTIFSIVWIKPTGDYEMIQNFTSDKSALLKAVDKIRGSTAGYEEKLMKTSQLSDSTQLEQCVIKTGTIREECIERALYTLVQKANSFASEDQVRSSNAIKSMKQLFELARHVPGQKSVILVSEGADPAGTFYYNYAANVIQYFIQHFGIPNRHRTVITEIQIDANRAIPKIQEVRELVRTANGSGLSVYWANPEYGKEITDISAELGRVSSFNEKYVNAPDVEFTMRGLAEDTGGAALSSSDYAKFYQRIRKTIPNYYLISYKPPRAVNDGKYHRIEVRPKDKRYTVMYQKDFRDLTLKERVETELAGALDFPDVSKHFRLLNDVSYFKKSNGEYHLMVRIGVPYEEIQPTVGEKGVLDDVHFSILIRDGEGEVVVNQHPILYIRSKADEFEMLQKNKAVLEFVQSYVLKQGDYQVSLAAMDVGGWKTSADAIAVKLPGSAESCLSISPAMLAGGISPSEKAFKEPTPTEKGEILYGDKSYSFPVTRIFPTKGALTGFYQVYNARVPSVYVSFKLYRDKTVFINQTPEKEISAFTDPLQKLISNYFSVPYNNLSPGTYELEISVREKDGKCVASTREEFQVVQQQG